MASSKTLQIKRTALDSNRKSYTPKPGELIFTEDKKRLYVGSSEQDAGGSIIGGLYLTGVVGDDYEVQNQEFVQIDCSSHGITLTVPTTPDVFRAIISDAKRSIGPENTLTIQSNDDTATYNGAKGPHVIVRPGIDISLTYDSQNNDWSIQIVGFDSLKWSDISEAPTTLSGYGITDGVSKDTFQSELETFDQLVVHTTSDETISGTKTFTLPIEGDITGTSALAQQLAEARTITLSGTIKGSAVFDGSGDIEIVTESGGTGSSDHTHDISNINGLEDELKRLSEESIVYALVLGGDDT